jgi:molybdopterin-binding protein
MPSAYYKHRHCISNPYRSGGLVAGSSRFDSEEEKSEAWPRIHVFQSPFDGNEEIPLSTKLSARNQIEGKIVELEVDGVMAHVTVQVGKNLIDSVITRRSAEEMKLKVGDRVAAVIKSTEVMLQKG